MKTICQLDRAFGIAQRRQENAEYDPGSDRLCREKPTMGMKASADLRIDSTRDLPFALFGSRRHQRTIRGNFHFWICARRVKFPRSRVSVHLSRTKHVVPLFFFPFLFLLLLNEATANGHALPIRSLAEGRRGERFISKEY